MRLSKRCLATFCAGLLAGAFLHRAAAAQAPAGMEANKQVVLGFWHAVFDGHDVDQIKNYISPEFVQHNPTAPPGRQGLIDALTLRWPHPLPAGTFSLTAFDQIITQDDLVQLVQRRPLAEPGHPGATYDSYWFGLYRIRNGKIVEHWDSDRK